MGLSRWGFESVAALAAIVPDIEPFAGRGSGTLGTRLRVVAAKSAASADRYNRGH